ncbi:MAG: hypothetical protein JWM81_960 [Candidatus Saccharibacteria bacterium]|nr:hypothetical protein [Candidatus Saccharibacteria bacterium]
MGIRSFIGDKLGIRSDVDVADVARASDGPVVVAAQLGEPSNEELTRQEKQLITARLVGEMAVRFDHGMSN